MCKKCGKAILIDVMHAYNEIFNNDDNTTDEYIRYDINALNFISGCKLDTENIWFYNNGHYTDAFKQQINYIEMDIGDAFYDDHLPTMRKNFTKILEKYVVEDSILNTILAACEIESSK